MNADRLIEELNTSLNFCNKEYDKNTQSGDFLVAGVWAAKCNVWSEAIAIVKKHAEGDADGH